jgi:hypothetical protein
MRDHRHDRTRRAGVREERLRAASTLRAGSAPLSSWRGLSGRRYVVGVHPLIEAELLEVTDAVVLAVRRDDDGAARLVDAALAGSEVRERARTRWVEVVRDLGATELHVHRLAESDEERRAVVADLRDDEA